MKNNIPYRVTLALKTVAPVRRMTQTSGGYVLCFDVIKAIAVRVR